MFHTLTAYSRLPVESGLPSGHFPSSPVSSSRLAGPPGAEAAASVPVLRPDQPEMRAAPETSPETSRGAKMHCMERPWQVYDQLLSTILNTPDILARDGLVVMALEVGQSCCEPEHAHLRWFPETLVLSRPETIGALRGMTLVAQMLPPDAFRTEHHIVTARMTLDPATSPEVVREQIQLIAHQVTAIVNLQHLTRQVTTFHRSWHQLQGTRFELPPATMTMDEQGRLKTAAVLPLYGCHEPTAPPAFSPAAAVSPVPIHSAPSERSSSPATMTFSPAVFSHMGR